MTKLPLTNENHFIKKIEVSNHACFIMTQKEDPVSRQISNRLYTRIRFNKEELEKYKSGITIDSKDDFFRYTTCEFLQVDPKAIHEQKASALEKEKLERQRKDATKRRLQTEGRYVSYGAPVHLKDVRTLGIIHITAKPKPPPEMPKIKEEPKFEPQPLPKLKLDPLPLADIDQRKPILNDHEIPMSYREEPLNKPPPQEYRAYSENYEHEKIPILPTDLKKMKDKAFYVPTKNFKKQEIGLGFSEEQKEMYEGS